MQAARISKHSSHTAQPELSPPATFGSYELHPPSASMVRHKNAKQAVPSTEHRVLTYSGPSSGDRTSPCDRNRPSPEP